MMISLKGGESELALYDRGEPIIIKIKDIGHYEGMETKYRFYEEEFKEKLKGKLDRKEEVFVSVTHFKCKERNRSYYDLKFKS